MPEYMIEAYEVQPIEEEPIVAELAEEPEEEKPKEKKEEKKGKAKGKKVQLIVCPGCAFEFYIKPGRKTIKCPKCKLEGEV